MKSFESSRCALTSCATFALLVGCGGLQPPVGAPAMPQSPEIAMRAEQGGSWMLPEAQSQDLLYVGGNSGDVTVYSYPKGRLIGTLKNPYFYLPAGECVDKAGDVFITDVGANKIFAYRHAAKQPFETLEGTVGEAAGCAIDPTNGDLAVTSLGGNVAIYPNARGKPQTYVDPNVAAYYWCSYDLQGNLYVDGRAPSGAFAFAELSGRQKKWTDITLNEKIWFPGGVQTDGKYVAVGDQAHESQETAIIYAFLISGSSGTLKSTTTLSGSDGVEQFWIQGHRVIGGNHADNNVQYWHFPVGGNPTKTISKGVGGPIGMTVSKAAK